MFKAVSVHGSANVYVEGPDGKIYADAGIVGLYSTQEEAEEAAKSNVKNADRIAACLNACVGLDTKIIKTIAAFGGMNQVNAVAAVVKQRDELLEALLEIAKYPAYRSDELSVASIREIARKTISTVTQELTVCTTTD